MKKSVLHFQIGAELIKCGLKILGENIDTCRKQNPLIYAKSSELYRYPELQEFYLKHRDATILDVVHPETWIGRLMEVQNAFNQMQAELARLNRA